MSFQPRKKVNALNPKTEGAVDAKMLSDAVPRRRPKTKTRVVRIVRRREQPVGFSDVPETPTGALEVFSADQFAFDAGILGRNIRRKFFP